MKVFAYLVLCFISGGLISAQVSLPDSEKNDVHQEQDSIFITQSVYNGRLWLPQFPHVQGTQFFIDPDWKKAELTINGRKYDGVDINYDMVNDQVIAPYLNTGNIIMNYLLLDSFSFMAGSRKYNFVSLKSDNKLIDGYLELIYDGNIRILRKWRKMVVYYDVSQTYQFREEATVFISYGNSFTRLKGKRNLYNLFRSHKNEIKIFIRKLNPSPDIKAPETFIPVFEYIDNLISADQ